MQGYAAKALWKLALDDQNKNAIAAIPQALQRLVASLESSSEIVQYNAAGALGALADDAVNRKAIAAVPGALERLVDMLETSIAQVQTEVAAALEHLADDVAIDAAKVRGQLMPQGQPVISEGLYQ